MRQPTSLALPAKGARMPAPVIELGPAEIAAITEAVDALMPWLEHARFRILASGNLEMDDPDAAEAVRVLREAVEEFLPVETRDLLGERSGLGWNIFFGHVLAWWLPMRRQIGFLRALVNRAEVLRVPLKLLWNRGRKIRVQRRRPGNEALLYGGGAGLVFGLLSTRLWPYDPVLALLALGGGVVLGRIAQRVLWNRWCGDRLCQAPLGNRKTCAFCGAEAESPGGR